MNKLCFEKFKRGQIWNVKKDIRKSIDGMRDKDNHIIEKSRPWLIVSNDISNKNAPILNCIPVTSRLYTLPSHITIRMEKGFCDIQCEQITTFNKKDFEDATYIGEITEEIMQKIEIALANQLGLSIQVPSLETLKAFIEQLANAKAEEMKVINAKATDDYVLSIAERLESIFNINNSNTVTVENSSSLIKAEDPMVIDDEIPNIGNSKEEQKPNLKTGEPKPSSKKSTSGIKRNNSKWTKEAMETFMQDSEKLSIEDMCKKYNMSTKSIYSTKYRFKNILNK